MAFTTAGTVMVAKNGTQQFQGLWSDMWAVTITDSNPASVAAGAEDFQTFTVPGVRRGDVVIGWSMNNSVTVDGLISIYPSADNVITILISNLNGSSALDYLSGTDWKILIGRPNW